MTKMSVVGVGSKNDYVKLDEVQPQNMSLGKMYHVVFEERNNDGDIIFVEDTAWCVNSAIKRSDKNEFYKALQFVQVGKTLMFSELPAARFFGPFRFEVTVE